jgi:hypothetical protein
MATGTPGTNGVWQYGEDDSEATFSALLNKAASTTDTAIGLDRGRLTTLEAKPTAGLIPVAPSSVDKTGGTASANSLGQVTFAGVSSISLNGVFTSSYTNYRIVFSENSAADAFISWRFRKAGSDNSASAYITTGFYANQVGTLGGVASYSTSTGFGITGTTRAINATMDIFSPFVSAHTKALSTNTSIYSPGTLR